MEKLNTYLEGRSRREFCGVIGISQSYLSVLLSGAKLPSLKLMRCINASTDGVVDLNSWAGPASLTGGGVAVLSADHPIPDVNAEPLRAVG